MMKTIAYSLFLWLISYTAHAVFIETLPNHALDHKTIAYFNGSFDPLHEGHIKMIDAVLAREDVAYLILYPNDGQSARKPNRTSKTVRQKAIDDIYATHPNVLLTHLDAYQLQQQLRQTKDTTFIGVLGADVVQEFEAAPAWDDIYLRGTDLKPDEGHHSKAPMMIVAVEQFFGFEREGSTLPDRLVGKRKIIKIDADIPNISSTQIRAIAQ